MHDHSASVSSGAQGIGKAIAAALIASAMHVLRADGGMTRKMIYV